VGTMKAAGGMKELERTLLQALGRELPGTHVQGRLAPRLRDGGTLARPPGTRDAAALLLVFGKADRPHLVLTLRAPDLLYHADQVSLPGGAMEPGESPEAAALREAYEEIGVPREIVGIAGRLTPLHIPVSGFTLHPVVGIARETPAFVPAPGEVARVLEVPLDELCDPARLKSTTWVREGREYDVPYFDVMGQRVWGATAMVLSEFLWLCSGRPPG
jgi:8-oxo-dGTP pyrophosphatase MutT (NUDIX family)